MSNKKLKKLCSSTARSTKPADKNNKQIIDLLDDMKAKGEIPELDSLGLYLKRRRYYQKTEIVEAFIESQTTITKTSGIVRKALISHYLNARTRYYAQKKDKNKDLELIEFLKKVESKGYMIKEGIFHSYFKNRTTSSRWYSPTDAELKDYVVAMNYFRNKGFSMEPFLKYLLFSNKILGKSKASYLNKRKDYVIIIIKELDLTKVYQPTQADLEKAYEDRFYYTIEILEELYGLKPNQKCFQALINGSPSSVNHGGHELIINFFKTMKLDIGKEDFKSLLLIDKYKNKLLGSLIDANLVDVTKFGSVIKENFETIKDKSILEKLIKLGLKVNLGCLQRACSVQGNLPIIKLLIEKHEIIPNDVCMINACKVTNNGPVIRYLLEKGLKTNVRCLYYYAQTLVGNNNNNNNNTSNNTITTGRGRFKKRRARPRYYGYYGTYRFHLENVDLILKNMDDKDGLEYMAPIYDDSEDEESKVKVI